MDELKLKLSTNFMRGIMAKLIARFIFKKFGCKVDIQLDEIEIVTIGDKIKIHAHVDADVNRDEFMAVVKKADLD